MPFGTVHEWTKRIANNESLKPSKQGKFKAKGELRTSGIESERPEFEICEKTVEEARSDILRKRKLANRRYLMVLYIAVLLLTLIGIAMLVYMGAIHIP